MAASTVLSYLLLCFVYSAAIASSSSSSSSAAIASSSSSSNPLYIKYIKTKCSTTTYPSLCRSSLYPRAAAVRSNPWKLCNAALSISVQSARNTSSSISKLLKNRRLTKIEAAIIKECTENLANSVAELKQSIQTMSKMARQRRNSTAAAIAFMEFQMSNVKTWVSAAITDEGTCGDDLDESKVSDGLRKKIKSGIVAVARLTSNALSLINAMDIIN